MTSKPTKAQARALDDIASGSFLWFNVTRTPMAQIHGRGVAYASFKALEREHWIVRVAQNGTSVWYGLTPAGRAALGEEA